MEVTPPCPPVVIPHLCPSGSRWRLAGLRSPGPVCLGPTPRWFIKENSYHTPQFHFNARSPRVQSHTPDPQCCSRQTVPVSRFESVSRVKMTSTVTCLEDSLSDLHLTTVLLYRLESQKQVRITLKGIHVINLVRPTKP